jgi:hypothetical protein
MNDDSRIYKFIVFCLEQYRYFKQITAIQALALFRQTGVFEYLADGYEVLHTQGRNWLMDDIQEFIENHSIKDCTGPCCQ